MAEMQEGYGATSYWEDWYSSTKSTFEWYMGYRDLKGILNRTIPKKGKILMVGAGNSQLPEQMVVDGYEEMVCIDYSPVVVDQMRLRLAKKEFKKYSYECMDATKMKYANGSFDA